MASDAKSKILVIGGTGYIGKHVVAASARLGHPTLALVRDTAPSDPAKAQLLKTFQDSGVTLLKGDLYDHGSLVSAVKAADVVISTLGAMQIAEQTKLIAAIKEAGNVKRFFPSEFGLDVDRTGAVEPAKSIFAIKAGIRRAIEGEDIPYTYVVANYFAGYSLPTIGQVLSPAPPTDNVVILGDGETKVVFVDEADIGAYTVLAADDPRAENKVLYIKPPANTLSHNELVALWEKKTGKTFQRVYVPEDAVLKQIQEAPIPMNIIFSIGHASYIKGDQTNIEIAPSFGVEASELYPDVKYTTVDDLLNRLCCSGADWINLNFPALLYTGGRLVLDLQGDDEEETKAKGMCSSGICFALQDRSCTPPPTTCTTHGVSIFTGPATCTTHGVDAPWRWRPAATTSASGHSSADTEYPSLRLWRACHRSIDSIDAHAACGAATTVGADATSLSAFLGSYRRVGRPGVLPVPARLGWRIHPPKVKIGSWKDRIHP
ncbi:hypothetical protein ZWY2020_044272 [Hordeum vulgare]|nr:hypothetical protein ZWY2020_044272 [Hordeum vulgare]